MTAHSTSMGCIDARIYKQENCDHSICMRARGMWERQRQRLWVPDGHTGADGELLATGCGSHH